MIDAGEEFEGLEPKPVRAMAIAALLSTVTSMRHGIWQH